MKRALAFLSCLLALTAGCSGKRDPKSLLGPTGAGTIVVDARMIVGQVISTILLSTTQSPDRPYDRSLVTLGGAQVFVYSSEGDTMFYREGSRGRYTPNRPTAPAIFEVHPRTTYFLRVEAADGRVVTAQTTTPDSFRVREWLLVDEATLATRRRLAAPADFPASPDSVFDADSNQLIYQDGLVEARFDRGNAIAFQMALFNLEDRSPLLIDADFLSEADKASLDRESSSPPLDAPDGYARLPWLAVWFEGRHRFVIYSVDRNWYDVARSVRFNGPNNLGFGSSAGDDFERPIFHINGGIGLFGSAAMDETGFTVRPRP
jgi:hypothetical protein